MISSKKKSFLKVLRNIVITVLAVVISTFAVTKIVYDAVFKRYDCVSNHYSISDFNGEEIEFLSGDKRLYGCLYGGGGDVLVVFIPGFHACTDDYLPQIKSFADSGFGVFAFDPTGSGKSEGDTAVGFSQIICDLKAALETIRKNDNFGFAHTVLFGHSRGGYAACCAVKDEYDISAVVSVAGINSAMEGVIQPAADKVGFLAYGNYPMLWAYQAMLFGADTVDSDAAKIISNSDIPVLIIHGKNDEQVPRDEYSVISHRDEICSTNAEYIICDTPGMDGHVDLLFDGDGANEQLMNSIKDFYLRSVH